MPKGTLYKFEYIIKCVCNVSVGCKVFVICLDVFYEVFPSIVFAIGCFSVLLHMSVPHAGSRSGRIGPIHFLA